MNESKRRKLNSKSSKFFVKVRDAGIEEVNGRYYPTEFIYDEVPVYTKCGSFQNRDDCSFVIWRYNDYEWCISTLKKGKQFQRDEIDYYLCHKIEKSSAPPESGWGLGTRGIIPPPTISLDIKKQTECLLETNSKILNSEKFSDVHFHCPDGTILHAHKLFLSSSSTYFATVFDGPWDDEHPDGVWKTSNSADLMRIMLQYIYTHTQDNIEVSKDPLAVLSLAHEYDLMPLVNTAASTLKKNICKDNIKEVLLAATLYDLKNLKEYCFSFISLFAKEILTDEDFMEFSLKNLTLWRELIHFLWSDE